MVTLNKVRRDAPWKWLKAGWEDFIRAPQVSLLYGLIFVGVIVRSREVCRSRSFG